MHEVAAEIHDQTHHDKRNRSFGLGGMQVQIKYPKTTATGMQKVAMKAVRRESCNAMLY